MGKNYRVVPIRSLKEANEAKRKGARFEYTGCGCGYNLPLSGNRGSRGWVPSLVGADWFAGHPAIGISDPVDGRRRVRAVYPAKPHIIRRLFGRLFGREEAA